MDWSLQTLYLACAGGGGLVLLLQTVLLLLGHDDGGDSEVADSGPQIGHADSSGESHEAGLGVLSVRTVAAFLCFFGLAGWSALSAGWSKPLSLAAGLGAGLLMLFVVAWLFSLQRRLAAQGNLEPARAVGTVARVYLRIPPAGAGQGKVQASVQGRTAEFQARTRALKEIPTGADVRIVRQITADTFEVEPLAEEKP